MKIVLGGLVGLTLGYFALLWGFGMDVLDLGPKMAPYAPWIVPAKFHGQPAGIRPPTPGAGNGHQWRQHAGGHQQRCKRREGHQRPAVEGVGRGRRRTVVGDGSRDAHRSPSGDRWSGGGLGGITVEPELKPIPLPEPDPGPLLAGGEPEAQPCPRDAGPKANRAATVEKAKPKT